PAARELSRRDAFGLAVLDYRSPGMDGAELDGQLKQVQPGTVGARETGFAAEATTQAVTQTSSQQGPPVAVGFRRPVPALQDEAGGAVTVRHKTGKEAQPCAPARCWAYCFLPRKEGARKGKPRPISSSARSPAASSRNSRASGRGEPALAGD